MACFLRQYGGRVLLIVGTAVCSLALGLSPQTAQANLVWEDNFDDEEAIVSGSSITVPNGTTITFGRTVFSDFTGGTFDLDPYRNDDYLTFEQGQMGQHFGYLEFSMDNQNDDPDDYVELSLNFDRAITDLQFALLDIDSGTWDDAVEVYFNGSNNARDNAGISVVTGSNVGTDNKSYMHGWEGLGKNNGNGQSDGNIEFDFGSLQITSLTIRYFSTDDAKNNPGGQVAGLSDLSFVEAVPEPASWACMSVFGVMVLMISLGRRHRQQQIVKKPASVDHVDTLVTDNSATLQQGKETWTIPFPAWVTSLSTRQAA